MLMLIAGKNDLIMMLEKRKQATDLRRVDIIRNEELLIKSLCSDSNDDNKTIFCRINTYIQSIDNDIINPFGTDKSRMKELINDLSH